MRKRTVNIKSRELDSCHMMEGTIFILSSIDFVFEARMTSRRKDLHIRQFLCQAEG
jgi:hypothetical protein